MLSRTKLPAHKFLIAMWVGVISVFIAFGMLYHTSSQGDLSETYPKGFRGGACTIETDALTIGYSGYYLPKDYESSIDTIRSPYVPVQCGKVPEPATLNISIDLLYPDSARDFMLGLRLVQVEIDEKENQKEHEILSTPTLQHRSGVITLAFKLREPGQYILYLNGKNTEGTELQVKIPLQVGLNWMDHLKKNFSTFLKNY